jgi:hypothetical protein
MEKMEGRDISMLGRNEEGKESGSRREGGE